MFVLLIYRPRVDANPGLRHGQHPFEGVEVICLAHTEEEVNDAIDHFKLAEPEAQFHYEEVAF